MHIPLCFSESPLKQSNTILLLDNLLAAEAVSDFREVWTLLLTEQRLLMLMRLL